jgi:hypothetical protein
LDSLIGVGVLVSLKKTWVNVVYIPNTNIYIYDFIHDEPIFLELFLICCHSKNICSSWIKSGVCPWHGWDPINTSS